MIFFIDKFSFYLWKINTVKKLFLIILTSISLISCSFSDKQVYKNLHIANGGEFSDYSTATIKLESGNQLNIIPFEVNDYEIKGNYILFKCIDSYAVEKFYIMDKDFDEFNYEQKIYGPYNREEFKENLIKRKIKSHWN